PVLLNPAPAVANLDFERIRSVEFFVPNETELAIVSGMPVDSRESATRAAAALVARGLKHVLVTLGDQGSLLVSRDGARHVPGVPV
ncbi:ribokinase, partial [Bacteroides thetaiotaomicron]|nr:ribokinase [Bacteroides thetaiotaomicron]